MTAFIQNIGPIPLLVILILTFLIFGTRLPTIARNVGRSLWSFRRGLAEGEREIKDIEKEIGDGTT